MIGGCVAICRRVKDTVEVGTVEGVSFLLWLGRLSKIAGRLGRWKGAWMACRVMSLLAKVAETAAYRWVGVTDTVQWWSSRVERACADRRIATPPDLFSAAAVV